MKALKVGRKLLCCFSSAVILVGFLRGDATAGSSFRFCLQIEGTTKCYDVHKGPLDENLPGDQLLFGAQLNTQANSNFVTAVQGTFKFSIAHDMDYLQIINTSSARHEWRKLGFHPLTMRMIPGSSSANPQLYVLGVNVSAQCNMEHQLVLHYLVFSDNYCNFKGAQKHWCPSSPHSRTLSVNRSCSLPWPSFTISQDGGGGVVLVYENSHSNNLFCYSLESGSQCSYTLGELPMGYSIVAVHPYKEETIILQIKYLVSNGYQYKCYYFGSPSGLRDISEKCSAHTPMVTPSTFRSKSGSILHYNAKLQSESKFGEFDDVTCDPIEFDGGQGLIYCNGTSVVIIKRPDLANGEQTLTTPHPICKDGNSAYIWITGDGKQLAMLLCPSDQYRYLLGIVEQNGTYQFVEIRVKSYVRVGQISAQTSFFRGDIYVVDKQPTLPWSPSAAPPSKQNDYTVTIIILSVLAAVMLFVTVIVFAAFVGCLVGFKKRRRRSESFSANQDEGEGLVTGTHRGTADSLAGSSEQFPLDPLESRPGLLQDDYGIIAERQHEGSTPGLSGSSSTVANNEQVRYERTQSITDLKENPHTGHICPSGRQQLLTNQDGVDFVSKEVSSLAATGTQQTTLSTSHKEVPADEFQQQTESLAIPSQDSSAHRDYFGEMAYQGNLVKSKQTPIRPEVSGEDEIDSSSNYRSMLRNLQPDGGN